MLVPNISDNNNACMITLRRPTTDEHQALSTLCLRSKAHWGYDQAFMERCVDVLTISQEDLKSASFQVAVCGEIVVGVARLDIDDDRALLDMLYVDPSFMGHGTGRRLFDWAACTARESGARHLDVIADPNAVSFYVRMGAVEIGLYPSEVIPTRMLPKLSLRLNP